MRYYSEKAMKGLRSGFEEKVLRWPQVSTKKMFGRPSYQANGTLVAFLVTDGVVITRLGRAEREALYLQSHATTFQAGKKVIQTWVRLFIEKKRDLDRIMPFVRKSYESALRNV